MRCQNCHRELTGDEPVYRVATGHAVGSLCAYCATQSPDAALFLDQRWRPPQRCCHCGRPVILNGRRRLPRHVACSDRCRQAARNTAQWEIVPSERACPTCGVTFSPKRIDTSYCSHACQQRAYRNRHGHGELSPSERACPICGVTFMPRRSDATYCSHACRQSAYRNSHRRAELSLSERACPICGVTFAPKRSDTTYCSRACRQRAYLTRQAAGSPLPGAASRSPANVLSRLRQSSD
jgi:hypothetical protein